MSNKILIIIIVVVLLILGVMGAGFFLMWQKMSAMQTAVPPVGAEAEAEVESNLPGPILPLDTIIVNLADAGGGRYLRVTMELELVPEEGAAEAVNQRLAQIKDVLLTILPTKQFDELTSVEGKNSLRDEIISALNGVLNKELVKKMYFTEFVIQ
ncbi:MAG: flagellar basal body-associated FliL family protein [Desulfobacterales bacterium]|jgi:flagellar FliL protein